MAAASARARLSWAFYDWAAQPYFTVVLTFIFGPYFQNHMAPSLEKGQAWWLYAQAGAGFLIALTGPVVGAIADRGGRPKAWVGVSVAMMVLGLCATWAAVPGADARIVWVLMAIALASIGAEYGIIFTDSMLPQLAKPGQIGRLSGFGWAMGYLGGLIMLLLVLGFLALPEQPLWGLDRASHEPDRAVGPLAALWLVVFSLPLFLFVKLPSGPRLPLRQAVTAGLGQLAAMARQARVYRNIGLFLLARMAYYDGIVAVFTIGGLYAAGTFGWQLTEQGVFGMILIVFGTLGVAIGGYFDDRFGPKAVIGVSVAAIGLALAGVLSVDRAHIGFVFPVAAPAGGDGLFASTSEQVMIALGAVIGFFLGPVQAASRSLMARLAPADSRGAFFGLYALSGRATTWVASAIIAVVTDWTDSRRLGIATILILLLLGLVLLSRVKVQALPAVLPTSQK
ncbi:MAG: MFS transporter [Sphingomonadales bacterium]